MAEWVRKAVLSSGAWPNWSSYEVQKRLFDLVFGSLLLLLSLPVMLCIAGFIGVVSRRPIIFTQKRIGLAGAVFVVYKFRSMHEAAGGPFDQIVEDDERIITGGKFLRSTHLDELPQLWNVLTGEMSLVGPRPRVVEVDREWSMLDRSYLERRLVRPGITGPAQLGGRSHTQEEKRKTVRLEREYIRNWSVWLDFVILLLTIPAVLFRKGV